MAILDELTTLILKSVEDGQFKFHSLGDAEHEILMQAIHKHPKEFKQALNNVSTTYGIARASSAHFESAIAKEAAKQMEKFAVDEMGALERFGHNYSKTKATVGTVVSEGKNVAGKVWHGSGLGKAVKWGAIGGAVLAGIAALSSMSKGGRRGTANAMADAALDQQEAQANNDLAMLQAAQQPMIPGAPVAAMGGDGASATDNLPYASAVSKLAAKDMPSGYADKVLTAKEAPAAPQLG